MGQVIRRARRWMAVGLVLMLALTPGAALAQGGTVTHVVSPGENLFRISQRYGVTVQAMMAANGLANPAMVYAGQRLVVPGSGSGNAVAPPVSPANAPGGARVHVVGPGENLVRIGVRYGVSAWSIAWANGLTSPNLVYVGQRLVIPNPQGSALPQPGAPSLSAGTGKEIVVVLREQRVYAYDNGQLVRTLLASTGIARYPTPPGRYRIYVKYISTLMSGPGYYLPRVPYTMYFYGSYGLHGTYWHNSFGRPMSHGCVNLPTPEAAWLFNWAPVGTPVTVRW